MILDGVKALNRASGAAPPAGLSRRVSTVTTPEQIATLLTEVWPKSTVKPIATTTLEEALLDGLFASVPGGAYLMPAKERPSWNNSKGTGMSAFTLRWG